MTIIGSTFAKIIACLIMVCLGALFLISKSTLSKWFYGASDNEKGNMGFTIGGFLLIMAGILGFIFFF